VTDHNTGVHPTYAGGCIFVHTDEDIVCVPLTGR
jgi:hypothetical protein